MKIKTLLFEMSLIVIAASAFAFAYNIFSDKPLPLIPEKKIISAVDDSIFELSGMESNVNSTSTQIAEKQSKPGSEVIAALPAEKESTNKGNQPEAKPASAASLETLKKSVTFEQIVQHLNNPNVVIVDARPEELYNAGHIGNAVNIHPYWSEEVYISKLTSLPSDKIIIIYCDGGNCDLSHEVAKDLLNMGFQRVLLYYGGWAEWVQNKQHLK